MVRRQWEVGTWLNRLVAPRKNIAEAVAKWVVDRACYVVDRGRLIRELLAEMEYIELLAAWLYTLARVQGFNRREAVSLVGRGTGLGKNFVERCRRKLWKIVEKEWKWLHPETLNLDARPK